MLAHRSLLAVAGVLVLATGLGVAAVRWDRPVMDALYLQPAWLLPAVRVLTRLGSWMVLVPAGALGIWFAIRHHGRELAVRLGVGMAAAETFSELFKLIVGRARPDFLFQVSPRGASFPSGHSLNSLVVLSLLALVIASAGRRRKAWARLLYLIPALVGWTRVYLGVHWPSDVLSGWGFGLLLIAAVAGSKSPALAGLSENLPKRAQRGDP